MNFYLNFSKISYLTLITFSRDWFLSDSGLIIWLSVNSMLYRYLDKANNCVNQVKPWFLKKINLKTKNIKSLILRMFLNQITVKESCVSNTQPSRTIIWYSLHFWIRTSDLHLNWPPNNTVSRYFWCIDTLKNGCQDDLEKSPAKQICLASDMILLRLR